MQKGKGSVPIPFLSLSVYSFGRSHALLSIRSFFRVSRELHPRLNGKMECFYFHPRPVPCTRKSSVEQFPRACGAHSLMTPSPARSRNLRHSSDPFNWISHDLTNDEEVFASGIHVRVRGCITYRAGVRSIPNLTTTQCVVRFGHYL